MFDNSAETDLIVFSSQVEPLVHSKELMRLYSPLSHCSSSANTHETEVFVCLVSVQVHSHDVALVDILEAIFQDCPAQRLDTETSP